MKKVKLENGKVLEVKSLTWKQAKQIKFFTTIGKYNAEENKNVVIDEEDMDKIISLVVPEEMQDEISINDALNIFNAVLEETFTEKKQK